MRPLYLFLVAFLFSYWLGAQENKPLYLFAEVGQNNFHIQRYYNYKAYSSSSWSSLGVTRQQGGARGAAGSIGVGYEIHPRWQLEGSIAYGRGKVSDTLVVDDALAGGIREIIPVQAKGLWSTLRVTYQIQKYPGPWRWLVHTGLNYGGIRYTYLSSFLYDIDRSIYDIKLITTRILVNMGIPIGARGEYRFDNGLRLGLNAQINIFFDGYQQTSLSAFAALPIGG